MSWVNLSCGWLNMALVARIDLGDPAPHRRWYAKSAGDDLIAKLSDDDIETLKSTGGFPHDGPGVDG